MFSDLEIKILGQNTYKMETTHEEYAIDIKIKIQMNLQWTSEHDQYKKKDKKYAIKGKLKIMLKQNHDNFQNFVFFLNEKRKEEGSQILFISHAKFGRLLSNTIVPHFIMKIIFNWSSYNTRS
jgi:hypothetical protein